MPNKTRRCPGEACREEDGQMEDIKIDYKKLVKRVNTDQMGDFISYDESKCNGGCGDG